MSAPAAPMKNRRRAALPGMPAPELLGEPAAPPDPDGVDRPLETADTARTTKRGETAEPRASSRRRSTTGDRATSGPTTKSSDRSESQVPAVNPYAGAGTQSLNVRILVPLHARYRKLVRDLEEEGYRASATELFQALLHFGPQDTREARELLRTWRALLAADPSDAP